MRWKLVKYPDKVQVILDTNSLIQVGKHLMGEITHFKSNDGCMRIFNKLKSKVYPNW